MARPTKYNSDMLKIVEDTLAEGYSITGVAANLGISIDTLYRWEKENPEFSECIKANRPQAQMYMERLLKSKLSGKPTKDGIRSRDIDTSCLIFALKTRFHKTYGEKQEITQKGEVAINITPDDAEL